MFTKIADTYKRSFSGLSRETWLLSWVMLINRAGTMAVPFMGLYVTRFLHRPLTDATLLISLFGVGSVFGAIVGGKMTDVVGFRPVQIFAQLVSGCLFIVFSYLRHFPSMCVLTVLISFISESFRPANFTAIAAYAAEGKHTRSYSLNRLAINLGWAIGGSLGGIIASINYQLLFWVDGISNVLAGLCIVFFLPSAKAFKKTMQTTLDNIKALPPWKDMVYMKFTVICTFFATCFFLLFRLIPIFWKTDWHVNEAYIGMILGINGIIVAIFEMVLVARWENKRSPFSYIVTGVLLTSTAYFLMMSPGYFPIIFAIMGVILISVGEMLTLPFINGFVMKRSSEATRGQYAAAYTLTWSIAQVIGPLGGGFVAEKLGYRFLWALLAIICLFCAFAFKQMGHSLETQKVEPQRQEGKEIVQREEIGENI